MPRRAVYFAIDSQKCSHDEFVTAFMSPTFPFGAVVDVGVTTATPRRADLLEPGDCIDLEGDGYAGAHPEFAFKIQIVLAIERETADCIRVDLESGLSFGFPPDHQVFVFQ